MTDLPTSALSASFEQARKGRRLHCALFTTFQFDPSFFELNVLPVFLDVPLSQVDTIRSVQLEQALQSLRGEIAVYYDVKGLLASGGTAKLDVRRIGVRHKAVFHPKNVYALVDNPPGEGEPASQSLLVGTMSANLTRSGWWENVEVCHIEELRLDQPSRMAPDILGHLGQVRRLAPTQTHAALDEIQRFLRKVPAQSQRKRDGLISTHFHGGGRSVFDMIAEVAGNEVRGCNLEIISPYFDSEAECSLLKDLIKRFKPRETRVCLPISRDGAVGCSEAMYDAISSVARTGEIYWSRLSKPILARGKTEGATDRFVHAKVFRFFSTRPKAEYIFCGSVNFTHAACLEGGNLESGVFVQTPAKGPLDFWTTRLDKITRRFDALGSDEPSTLTAGSNLSLRYRWNDSQAEAHWSGKLPSPELELKTAKGVSVGSIVGLAPSAWTPLGAELSGRFATVLVETALIDVLGETEQPLRVLVQEEGMTHKPSLLRELSPGEILRYWALLTVEQRAAFIENCGMTMESAAGSMFGGALKRVSDPNNLFDKVAGIFHAFGCLERAVLKALEAGDQKAAMHRIFGAKYDSLGGLLDKVSASGEHDPVDGYLIFLCASQLCSRIQLEHAAFWKSDPVGAAALKSRLARVEGMRSTLVARNPGGAFDEFLPWFERQFLARATPEPAHAD